MGHFDSFNDDPLAEVLKAPLAAPVTPPATYKPLTACPKCAGSGRFVSWNGNDRGPCFACNGAGKTSKPARKPQASLADKIAAFRAANPAIAQWLDTGGNFRFCVAMREALAQWGRLTDGQIAACQRCIDGRAKAIAEKQTAAPAVSATRLEGAFAKAIAAAAKGGDKIAGLCLRLDTFKISPARATSRNAGALYVTDASTAAYLGKIMGGKFVATRECTSDQSARILAAAADPASAAIAYGQRFKECSCCGRTLTTAESRARGIGPICADKYGF